MNGKSLDWLTARPIAHRGLHDETNDIIENTASAFQAAIAKNFAIQLDVQITKDGQVAVFHDDDLERLTTSSARVDSLTMDELREIPFKQGSDRIQSLPEILSLINGQVAVVIELKTPAKMDGSLEKQVSKDLEGYEGNAAIMSFAPQMVETLKDLTDRPRGIVSCDYFTNDEDGAHLSEEQRYAFTHFLHAKQTKPDFISYCIDDLPQPSLDLMRALYELPVICWTARTLEQHNKAMSQSIQVTFEGYDPDSL